MASEIDPLASLVKEKEQAVAKAKSVLRELQIELSALQQAYEVVSSSKSKTTRNRSLSEEWKAVLSYIANEGAAGATTDELYRWCELLGHKINRETLRSQMSIYTNKGFLKRISEGRFSITPEGMEASSYKPKIKSTHDWSNAF